MTTGIKDTNFIDRSDQDSIQRNAGLQLQTSAVNTSAGISDSRADNDNARDGSRLLFGLEGPGSGLNEGKTQN